MVCSSHPAEGATAFPHNFRLPSLFFCNRPHSQSVTHLVKSQCPCVISHWQNWATAVARSHWSDPLGVSLDCSCNADGQWTHVAGRRLGHVGLQARVPRDAVRGHQGSAVWPIPHQPHRTDADALRRSAGFPRRPRQSVGGNSGGGAEPGVAGGSGRGRPHISGRPRGVVLRPVHLALPLAAHLALLREEDGGGADQRGGEGGRFHRCGPRAGGHGDGPSPAVLHEEHGRPPDLPVALVHRQRPLAAHRLAAAPAPGVPQGPV